MTHLKSSYYYLKSHRPANAQIFIMHNFARLMQCKSQISFRDGFMDEQVGMPRPEESTSECHDN